MKILIKLTHSSLYICFYAYQLSESKTDLTQRYAAMGLRFLAADPDVR